MISTTKSQTCNFSIQFSGSCDQSANSLNKRNHDHANVSSHNSHHQFYLITSVHGNNPSQEGLNSVDTAYSPSRIENVMRQTPIWKASSSLFTQAERLKAVGVPKTSKYSDTHTHPWDAHYGPVYPSMPTPDVCIPLCSPCTCVFPLCLLRTCVYCYVHDGPVHPSVPTTDLYFPQCSLRSPLYT